MASYLLLRSNKESGPYDLGDLVKIGLKAYDLVWVQGKSAAWRYPSEIEELKPYAPVVEEQPFDRFFKKNTQEAKQEPVIIEQPSVTKSILTEEVPTAKAPEKRPEEKKENFFEIDEKYEKYIPKKSVFVTMPGQKTINVQKPVPIPPPAESAPIITVTENPAAQIKYSQPLDEIKEMYVKTLQERKNKMARKSYVIGNLKKVAVVAGLVAMGVLAGFAIKGSGADDKLAQQVIHQPGQSSAFANSAPAEQTATRTSIDTNGEQPPADASAERENIPAVLQQRLIRQEKEDMALTQQKEEKQPAALDNSKTEKDFITEEMPANAIESNPSTGERSRRLRTDNNDAVNKSSIPATRKSGLDSKVSVTSNDYKRVAFGGIRNLELTVTNDSKRLLDKVTVELQYLKPSEEPLKTELIQFHSIAPNGSLTMRIKDTNRGIKVLYKIVDIQAAQQETAASGF